MRSRIVAIAIVIATLPCTCMASQSQPMCAALRTFVASVNPGKAQQIEFHTIWGSNFKDSSEAALSASRCVDHGYAPAKDICTYLLSNAQVEFAGDNVNQALVCFSRSAQFNPRLQPQAEFSFFYGAGGQRSHITIQFGPSPELGGEVLVIRVNGY
jgi:hypothetical protein